MFRSADWIRNHSRRLRNVVWTRRLFITVSWTIIWSSKGVVHGWTIMKSSMDVAHGRWSKSHEWFNRPCSGWTNVQHLGKSDMIGTVNKPLIIALSSLSSWPPLAVSSCWGSYIRTFWLPWILGKLLRK